MLVEKEETMSKDMEATSGRGMQSPAQDRTKELLLSSGNCAQTTFSILNEDFNLEGEMILKALTPFPGIALRGETCGAVIGSLMALGLVYDAGFASSSKARMEAPPAQLSCKRSLVRHTISLIRLKLLNMQTQVARMLVQRSWLARLRLRQRDLPGKSINPNRSTQFTPDNNSLERTRR
jgi:hypothetical protein